MKHVESIITCNHFLSRYLNIYLEATSSKKWSHTKISEVLREKQLEEMLCVMHQRIDDKDILSGRVLLVRDHYGKIKSYYNPITLRDGHSQVSTVQDLEMQIFAIERQLKQNTDILFQTHFRSFIQLQAYLQQMIVPLETQRGELEEVLLLIRDVSISRKIADNSNKQKRKDRKRNEKYNRRMKNYFDVEIEKEMQNAKY